MHVLKYNDGKHLIPLTATLIDNRIWLKFRYHEKLKDEVKVMEGARWDPDSKQWHVTNSHRNLFTLQFLGGGNPYAWFEKPLVEFTPRRHWLKAHQREMAAFALTRHYALLACEMGTGKTLTMIEVIEQSGFRDWWWCGPRNAIFSVKNEFKKWALCSTCKKTRSRIYLGDVVLEPCTCPVFFDQWNVIPRFLSYEELKKEVDAWPEGQIPPRGICYDESSRGKNPTAQRSRAMLNMANAIREHWKFDGYVVEMTGSPAPKEPTDWWHQAEIAQPGYLREGDVHKFRRRLAIIEQRENTISGGSYPQLITWLDDPKKCKQCGQLPDHPGHNLGTGGHTHQPSRDEISFLYKRLNGLALVKLKKDCLDLPDKVYETIELKPSSEMQRAASIIESRTSSAVQALTLLRELSDGFQYQDEDVGATQTCPRCNGTKVDMVWTYVGPESEEDEFRAALALGKEVPPGYFEKRPEDCEHCSATGEIPKLVRKANEIPTPKEAALKAQLDLHEEVGRIVIFGGFTGSIDRICGICRSEQWTVIRVDGRGWESSIPGSPEKLLEVFQDTRGNDLKIAFVGQPGAAGLGLNLTASPTIVYWSNDFNAESRIQSEDRIHRIGMSYSRGAKIIDFVCLKTDLLVLNNLQRKRRLQDLTLGQMREELKAITLSNIREY